jgi:hypothetical protein
MDPCKSRRARGIIAGKPGALKRARRVWREAARKRPAKRDLAGRPTLPIPYHKGGKTDACNAGARSRRCHQVKQMAGWTVTQPKPGWHVWTTPTGRTYTQEPWRYIA